ncbi:MAG: hypothetical protein ACUVUD_04445 [bacterium]
MRRQIWFWVLLGLGFGVFLLGTLIGNWGRIYQFSTQICLSCMGLV